jgi:hypothetical protein
MAANRTHAGTAIDRYSRMTATPTPFPWPAPTLADAAIVPPETQATVPGPRLTVASLVSTARRLSNRAERAEYAAMKQEQRIRDELTDLPAGWFVLHSPDIGELWNDGTHGDDGTDLDHVAIGPGGVFAIEVQHRSGAKVWVSEHQLTIDGQNSGDLRRARSQARRSSGRLSDACGFDVTVQAVLVLIGAATVQTLSRSAEVHVRTEHDLRDWLCRQPSRLDAEVVTTIHECVRRADRKRCPPPVAPGG